MVQEDEDEKNGETVGAEKEHEGGVATREEESNNQDERSPNDVENSPEESRTGVPPKREHRSAAKGT